MKRKRRKSLAKPQASDIKAFIKELRLLDRKLLILLVLILLAVLFVSQKSILDIGREGTVFGIKTSLFEQPTINNSPIDVPQPALYPRKISDTPAPYISAHAATVLDVASQVVLYQKNEKVQFPPASTTKIMTALVAMDYFKSDDVLTVPESAISVGGAKMGLLVGEQITFENLLYGLLLNSGSDAAETIAQNSPNGREGFIAAMNQKAIKLNLFNTHFEDPTGLASFNHFTTALDLARLASFALKNEQFARIVDTQRKIVSDTPGNYIHKLENLNKLLGIVEGVNGIKTGFTEEAGQVLATSATRNGHTILTVVLKSEDRFLDSKNLLEWVFANHTFTPPTHF